MTDRYRITELPAKGSGVAQRARQLRDRLPFDPVPWLIVLGAGILGVYSLRNVHQWHVMTDEMLYQKLSFGVLDGHFYPGWARNQPTDVRNTLFPMLIAPLFGALSMPSAVRGALVLNAFLMAGAAIPVYLLAREVLHRRLYAYLVAAMAVVTPWMAQAANVLTESTAYLAFTWALWGMQRCVRRRGVGADALALVLIGVAYLARTQFLVIAPALPAAVVVHEVVGAMAERLPGTSALRAARSG